MHGESQRCYATVFFADIHGFLSLAGNMDPEELICLVNCWFELTEPIIEFYGGIVDKYIGDCVMAFFKDSDKNHDSAKRAVKAAIEVRRSLYRFNAEKDMAIPMQLHIGINTGIVISGMVGGIHNRQITVMGDVVNIAARLEDISKEGQILVGLTTYEDTKDEFEYQQINPISIEDKRKISVYELLPVWSKFRRS